MSGVESRLTERLERLGREVGTRESVHAADLARARDRAASLHQLVETALAAFHAAASAGGAGHLSVALSPVRTDDKHLHAVEFDLERGRHRAIVTVKARGEVTLVGPFHRGKTEGPCRTFPIDAGSDLESALGDFLERFIEEAAAP